MEFKRRIIKYCEQDVKSLYQVIDTLVNIFLMHLGRYFKISYTPSLALAIYRTQFI